jgi:hypothetical protein
MAIGINVTKTDLEHLAVTIRLTGLSTSTHYDLMRMQMRYLGDDGDDPVYERIIPDRRKNWSAVAHRVGWEPANPNPFIHDYECPRRPVKYFLVESDKVGPYEFDFDNGNYPLSRGVIDDEVVHFNRDLRIALNKGKPIDTGDIVVRSTHELGKYATACVVSMDPLVYKARGNEFAVMGSQYPVFVADTREASRGSITVLARDLDDYESLHQIVFPPNGRIRPIILNAGGDPAMLLHDIRVLPMDISIEQATPTNADLRFVKIDYIEIDPTAPLVRRSGDNDDFVNKPNADIRISDHSPRRGQRVTLTDISTGQYDTWEWTIGRGTGNKVGRFYGPGPYHVHWDSGGVKTIKLRVYGSGAGADVVTKRITVH